MAEQPLSPNAPKLIAVEKNADVQLRQNILQLQQNSPIQFSQFIYAYNKCLTTNHEDPRSYYRIGGIHGEPYIPYNDAAPYEDPKYLYNRGSWGGYCHHGVITFPTWHRAYLLLLEKVIRDFAYELVEQLSGDDKVQWEAEWKKLRFPYLDWADNNWVLLGVPKIFVDTQLTVLQVSQGKVVSGQVRNPLRSYVFPVSVGQVILEDGGNPFNHPFNPNHGGNPYTPAGFPTVRHPDSHYHSDDDKLKLAAHVYVRGMLRPGVWQAFQVSDYNQFSNHNSKVGGDGKGDYGLTSSLEVVHDQVHDLFGGVGGHMSAPAVAGFDPVFFLHHCNVDRLFALWQQCYPDSWLKEEPFPRGSFTMKDGTLLNGQTGLTPFLGPNNAFLNSDDVRDQTVWGYNYPEIEYKNRKNISAVDFRKLLLHFYKPDKLYKVRWAVEFPNINKHSQDGVFRIRVFVNLPDANENTPIDDPHFGGQIFVFARTEENRKECSNCHNTVFLRGSVDITPTLVRLGIATHPEQTDLPPEFVNDGNLFIGNQDASDPNNSDDVLTSVAQLITVVVTNQNGTVVHDDSFNPDLHLYASVHESKLGRLGNVTPISDYIEESTDQPLYTRAAAKTAILKHVTLSSRISNF